MSSAAGAGARPPVPRRDPEGRVLNLAELLGVAVTFTVINALGILLIDGILAVSRVSTFGDSSGWLTLIFPALLYFDDFRAWKAYRMRWLAAPVAALVAVALGLLAAGLAQGWPALASGGVGALVAVLAYAPVWYLGIRTLTGEVPVAGPDSPQHPRRAR